MSDQTPPPTGSIGWVDLTVDDADGLRDFYTAVTGWRSQPTDMGGYDDHTMLASDGSAVAGVCNDRGSNAGLPATWLVYVVVADLDSCLTECTSRGGKVLHGPKTMGKDRYAIIEDPAGAACGLYEQSQA